MSTGGLRLVATSLLGALLVAGLTGCSGSSNGTDDKGETGDGGRNGTSEAAALDWELAYAKCLRDAGYDYPDPVAGSDGPTQFQPGGDLDEYTDATEGCEEKVTKERGDRPISQEKRAEYDHWNEVYGEEADCLRKKGYEVTTDDGSLSTEDDIPDADMQACSKGDPSQSVGGAE